MRATNSTNPSSGPKFQARLERFYSGAKWLGLKVNRAWNLRPDEGFVEFVARNKPPGGGPAQRLHEVSQFVRVEGRWQYIDAVDDMGSGR